MNQKTTLMKLLLSAVLIGTSALAMGQTIAEYNKANELIKDGQQYRIYSMVGGTKYYFTEGTQPSSGTKGVILGTNRKDAIVFTFTQNEKGAYTYNKGWQACSSGKYYFTNPDGKDTQTATNYLKRSDNSQKREWETQAWFAKEISEGSGEYSFAVRATTATGSQWGPDVFWHTFTPEGAESPTVGYDLSNETRGKATYYDFYLEEVNYTQLYGNEEVTKSIFTDANDGLSICPWRFFKSRPNFSNTCGQTDSPDYDAKNHEYQRNYGNKAYQKSTGEFLARVTNGSAYYSIVARYQNISGAEQWYKVENKVTADSNSEPLYMNLYYTATTATSGNLLNNAAPFHRTFAGNSTSDRVFYIKMAASSSLFIMPEGNAHNNTYGTIDYIKINAVDEADIPAGALCYNGTNLSYELNVTSAGYATLVLPFAAAKPENMVLYKLDSADKNGYIQCTEQESLTANEPVLVKADEGKYTFTATAAGNDASAEMTSGMLTGTYDRVQMETGNYLLQNQSGVVGFYKVGETTKPYVGAFRAYIKSSVNEVRQLIFNFGDETAIQTPSLQPATAQTTPTNAQSAFNLQGQRVDASYRGIVIVNGKKVIKK